MIATNQTRRARPTSVAARARELGIHRGTMLLMDRPRRRSKNATRWPNALHHRLRIEKVVSRTAGLCTMNGMEIKNPDPGRKRYHIRFRNWDGSYKTINAFDKLSATRTFASRVTELLEAKQQGDAPPIRLTGWIEAFPSDWSNDL